MQPLTSRSQPNYPHVARGQGLDAANYLLIETRTRKYPHGLLTSNGKMGQSWCAER